MIVKYINHDAGVRLAYEHDAAVPRDRLDHVLRAAESYPVWCSLVAQEEGQSLCWLMPLRNGDVRPMRLAITSGPAVTMLVLESRMVRVEMRVEVRRAQTDLSLVLVTTSATGPFAVSARRFALREAARVFCFELSQRAFWLTRGPTHQHEPGGDERLLIHRSRRSLGSDGSLSSFSNFAC